MASRGQVTGFEIRAQWRSTIASHVDTVHVAGGVAPARLVARAAAAGDTGFEPLGGVGAPARDPGLLLSAPSSTVRWRQGRFYASEDVGRVLRLARRPAGRALRCLGVHDGRICFDGNHPLAGREVALLVRGVDGPGQQGARVSAALARLLAGAGMQAPLDGLVTDFGDEDAWFRDDDTPDRRFYAPPRMVLHLDAAAIEVLHALYGRLLPSGARLLDLMASWRSHLPPGLRPATLVGLGMNETELAANRQLTGRVVHDLNQRPALPFADRGFDAAVCSVSVDYLCRPREVFDELARVLVAGGPLVVTFSDRFFPTKAVRLWRRLHDFERLALVLELLRGSGFTDLHSWSMRGLPRPADDAHAAASLVSDPVYAAWGRAPAR